MAVAEALEELGEARDENVISSVLSLVDRSRGMFVDGGRTRAMNFLGRVGGPEAIEGLARATRHDSMSQLSAIVALSNIPDPLIVRPVLEGLGPSVNAVSQTAAEALARLDESVLYQGLLSSFESGFQYARGKAVQSIAYYATDDRAADQLQVVASRDVRDRVRREAERAVKHLTLKKKLIEWAQEEENA
jgi:HEAT repeat protein